MIGLPEIIVMASPFVLAIVVIFWVIRYMKGDIRQSGEEE